MWVESIFVKAEYRRHGVATALHSKAEEIAASNGDDTVYNYVHPNNHCMIEFLRKRGYTVLNLIELRKLIICKYEDIADYKSIVSEHIVDRLVRFDAIYTESERLKKHYGKLIDALKSIMEGICYEYTTVLV